MFYSVFRVTLKYLKISCLYVIKKFKTYDSITFELRHVSTETTTSPFTGIPNF